MSETNTFVIKSRKRDKSPLELDLHNLKIQLRMQEEWVERTKQQIEMVEEKLRKQREG